MFTSDLNITNLTFQIETEKNKIKRFMSTFQPSRKEEETVIQLDTLNIKYGHILMVIRFTRSLDKYLTPVIDAVQTRC